MLLFAVGAWIGIRGYLAKGELEKAVPLAKSIQSQLLAGDGKAAAVTAAALTKHAESAVSLTSDPVWRAAEVAPWVGPNLIAMRTLTEAVDGLADDGIGPLSKVAETISLDDFKPVDGKVNLQPMVDAQPAIAKATTSVVHARALIGRIDSSEIIGPLAGAEHELSAALDQASDSLTSLNTAVQILPAMLGGDGPRNYLLLFQNNAELRSTGGIPGALALIHTDAGGLQLVQQASSTDFPRFDPPVIALPVATRALYGDNTAQYVQDSTFTPQFALTGQIAKEMWKQQFGTDVDGVLSVDPVALSYLLSATGPITLPTGDVLSAGNAVKFLLQDVYAKYDDPSDQNAFFAAAAAAVFQHVAAGDLDPKALLKALTKAGSERRVLVWSAHEHDQSLLTDTALAGSLPTSTGATQNFGLYLNDATGAKMDPYLQVKASVGQAGCRNDGLANYGLSITLTSTAPADAATSLPEYVTGGGVYGIPPGNIRTTVSVYASSGLYNLGVERDGVAADYHPASDEGRPLSKVTVELAPGQSTTLDFSFLSNKPGDRVAALQHTPLVNDIETSKLTISCENPLKY